MKKLLIPFFFIVFGYLQTQAQVPNGFNYQAVARDANGNVRSNETILVRFTLQPGVSATPTWIETHTAQTDGYGVFTLTLGAGAKVGGSASSFATVDFTGGDYWIMVEVKDGSNYVVVGSLQKFLSVPYALVSKTSLDNKDKDSTNELQILKLSNDTLYLERGGFVFLGGYNNKLEIQTETGLRISADQSLKAKIIADSSYLRIITNGLIANEINNRITAVNNVQSNLNSEITNRIIGDNSLRGKMFTDSSSMRSLLNTTNSNLTIETNARIAGDQGFKAKLVADSSYLEGQITNETTNRIAGDQGFKTKLIADSSFLEGKINTETNYRILGDQGFKAKLIADSSLLEGKINTESNARILGDQGFKAKLIADSTYLKGQITTETNARILGDQGFKAKQVADSTYLKGQLTTETNARILGDQGFKAKQVVDSTYLKGQITTETNARILGDQGFKAKQVFDSTYLKGLITTETNTRISAVNNISSKIITDSTAMRTIINTTNTNLSNETNARITAVNNLKTKQVADSTYLKGLITTEVTDRNNALNTETNARINGDNSIRSKMSSDSSNLKGLITTEATNRSNADNTLQSNLGIETSTRIIADNSIRSKMSSDSTSFRNITNTLSTNLNNEISTRVTNYNNQNSKYVNDSVYLKGLITNETNNRISGDQGFKAKQVSDSSFLKGQISTEINNRILGDQGFKAKQISDSSYLKGQISNEVNNRIIGDQGFTTKQISDSSFLKGQINTEINNRILGDQGFKAKQISDSTHLNGLINSESSSRTQMDYTLESNLNNEIYNRSTGDQDLKTKQISDSSYLIGIIDNKQDKLSAGTGLTLSGSTFSHTAHTGDATGSTTLTVVALQGRGISASAPNTGQVLGWNGSAWTPSVASSNVYDAGTGITLSASTFSAKNTTALWNASQLQGNNISTNVPTNNQVLKWNGTFWNPAADNNTLFTAGTGLTNTTNTFSHTAHTGDATGSTSITVVALQGRSLSTTVPISGNFLGWNGSSWIPSTPSSNAYAAGTGLSLSSNTFINTGDLSSVNEIQNLTYTNSTRALNISLGGTGTTLPLFSTTIDGLVPVSPGGTTSFLRADGTWNAPSSTNYSAGTGITLSGNTFSHTAHSGDVTGTTTLSVVALQGYPVSNATPVTDEILKWNGSAWKAAADNSNAYTAGSGLSLIGNTFTNTGDLSSTNELQTLSLRNDTILLTNGGFVKLPVAKSDSTYLKGLISTETSSRILEDQNLKTKIISDSSYFKGLIATVKEATDEFSATTAQTSFNLSITPSVYSKVKMYINGIRISNSAYTKSGLTITYIPANNGSYVLTGGDRVQFDYYY